MDKGLFGRRFLRLEAQVRRFPTFLWGPIEEVGKHRSPQLGVFATFSIACVEKVGKAAAPEPGGHPSGRFWYGSTKKCSCSMNIWAGFRAQ